MFGENLREAQEFSSAAAFYQHSVNVAHKTQCSLQRDSVPR